MQELRRLAPGMAVSDIANRRVGRVLQVLTDGFSVLREDGSVVSLNSDSLFAVVPNQAWLICGAGRVMDYELGSA